MTEADDRLNVVALIPLSCNQKAGIWLVLVVGNDKLIGGDGPVNPSGVTGGVAQALVATAIGLVIALVALFAFNFFARRVDRLMDELESFANVLIADVRAAHEARSVRS